MEDQQLTEHFWLHEFFHDSPVDAATDDQVSKCADLSERFLEPIRARMAQPLIVTSGYRAPAANASAGGVPNSFHQFSADESACDFFPESVDQRNVFDWIRLESGLPFDKVILEYQSPSKKAVGDISGAVIHIQAYLPGGTAPRRQAFIGCTGGQSAYEQVDVT